ncbi:MAG: PEP-utilizing enzyme [Candidatus Sericytochromatia bacterium]
MNLKNKAETLSELSKIITKAKILPVFILKVKDFLENKYIQLKEIKEFFLEDNLIIRSSSINEDSSESSNAGKFLSIADINKNNLIDLEIAIDKVINSYKNDNNNEVVLIQPFLKNIKVSGVIMTSDLDTLAPYYIINYDENNSHDSVTSGSKANLKTYISFKNKIIKNPEDIKEKLILVCKELELIFENSYLDIEFAIDNKNDIYIFQVRAIVLKDKNNLSNINLENTLEKLHKKINKLSAPHPGILGKKTLFGVMPDWNPAEIIGLKPKALAISLYKELITDNIWAYQRNNYGYRDLRSFPLLLSFIGVPYIDVRASFNSFIPKNLDEKIASKLSDYYINKLDKTPKYHDKVEFKIVHSCYYLNLPEKLKLLLSEGFNENEIKRIEFSLLELTNNIINPKNGIYKKDIEKVELLKVKYNEVINSNLSIIDKIYWLTEDCKRFGTLPFAGVARAGFIAVQFLKSFVDIGIFSQDEYNLFLNAINTISKELNSDLYLLSINKITKQEFLDKYGHLRPGTYDILSLRYDENFESYFDLKQVYNKKEIDFILSKDKLDKIDKELIENGIKISSLELIYFIKEAIKAREYVKFIFSRSLSKILSLIQELSNRFKISREDSAYIDFKEILNMYSILDHRDVYDILSSNIHKNKIFYEYTKAIKLPSLIANPDDIYGFFLEEDEPNFITLKNISAEVFLEENLKEKNPERKIVFIKSADPGYDFLFTKNIAGLVTQYGGANSHMAIRCSELGLPAIIGAGEKLFNEWKESNTLSIDCLNKKVIKL